MGPRQRAHGLVEEFRGLAPRLGHDPASCQVGEQQDPARHARVEQEPPLLPDRRGNLWVPSSERRSLEPSRYRDRSLEGHLARTTAQKRPPGLPVHSVNLFRNGRSQHVRNIRPSLISFFFDSLDQARLSRATSSRR